LNSIIFKQKKKHRVITVINKTNI